MNPATHLESDLANAWIEGLARFTSQLTGTKIVSKPIPCGVDKEIGLQILRENFERITHALTTWRRPDGL